MPPPVSGRSAPPAGGPDEGAGRHMLARFHDLREFAPGACGKRPGLPRTAGVRHKAESTPAEWRPLQDPGSAPAPATSPLPARNRFAAAGGQRRTASWPDGQQAPPSSSTAAAAPAASRASQRPGRGRIPCKRPITSFEYWFARASGRYLRSSFPVTVHKGTRLYSQPRGDANRQQAPGKPRKAEQPDSLSQLANLGKFRQG